MPTNEFLPFATGIGANVLSQADYAALGSRGTGFVAGTALSAPFNKAVRQSSVMAAMVAQFGLDIMGVDVPDDGDIDTVLDIYKAAIRSQRLNYFVAGGTANAWTVTFTPAPTALAELIGVPLRIFVTASPTGAVTLAVNGLAATALGDADGWALPVGYVHAGNLLTVVFDGSVFRIMAGVRPTCVPFSVISAASQAIPNSVWTQISPGADATYPNVGALQAGKFTFVRGGLYIVSFDATLVASVIGPNQIQGRVTAKIGGIAIAGTAPGDSNYGGGTGSYAMNISVVTAVVAGTGSDLTIEAQISANSNYTAGACNSLGLAIWPIN